MTLIARCTRDRIGASAGSRLTRIGLRTGVAIITHGAVLLRWIRARSALRIAGAGVMTLITRGTIYRIGSNARARLTGVGLGACIVVVTCRTVRLGRI